MAESIPTFTPLKKAIAEDGDKSDVIEGGTSESSETSVSQRYGIPPIFSTTLTNGGKFVQRQDINGLLNLVSQFQYYLQAGGFHTFDANVSAAIGGYPLGAILFYQSGADSCFVKSNISNNTNDFTKNPFNLIGTTSSYKWQKVTPSINDVKSGKVSILVVDSMPKYYSEGTFYFIRG